MLNARPDLFCLTSGHISFPLCACPRLPYPLVALSHTAPSVFDRAQQQLEWMSDHISAMFGAKRDNPMRMRCLQPLTGMDQLAHLPAGPKVWHGIGRMADRCENKHKLVQYELQMKAHYGRC